MLGDTYIIDVQNELPPYPQVFQPLISVAEQLSVIISVLTFCLVSLRYRLSVGTNEKIQLSSLIAAFQVTRDLIVTEAQLDAEEGSLQFSGSAVTGGQGTPLWDALLPGAWGGDTTDTPTLGKLFQAWVGRRIKKYFLCGCSEHRCPKF